MWQLSFLALIWVVWKERNKRCFEGVSSNVAEIVEKGEIQRCFVDFYFFFIQRSTSRHDYAHLV